MYARKALISCAIAAACALPAVSHADYTVIQSNPPVTVYEPGPTARDWVPGYWRWEGGRQVWVEGHFVSTTPAYREGNVVVYRDPDYYRPYRYRERDEEHHWWNRRHDDD
jgi:hypothetical protein